MTGLFGVSIEEQIAEVERELRMREHVYPRLVLEHKMLQRQSDKAMDRLRAALATLKQVRDGLSGSAHA